MSAMTDQQRQQWRETKLFPVELWPTGEGSTPLLCPMPDRALLRQLAEGIPSHIQSSGWYAAAQRHGYRTVYADDFSGMGRQHIAGVPSDKGRYFGQLADFIAAACPRTVLRLLDRIEELERAIATKEHPND